MVLTAITGFLASPLGKGVIGAVGGLFKKKNKKKASAGGTSGRNVFKSPIVPDGMQNLVKPTANRYDASNQTAPQTLFLTAEQQKMRPGAAGFGNTGIAGGVNQSFYNDPTPQSGASFSIPGSGLVAGIIASLCPTCSPEQVQQYANLGAGGLWALVAYKLFGR